MRNSSVGSGFSSGSHGTSDAGSVSSAASFGALSLGSAGLLSPSVRRGSSSVLQDTTTRALARRPSHRALPGLDKRKALSLQIPTEFKELTPYFQALSHIGKLFIRTNLVFETALPALAANAGNPYFNSEKQFEAYRESFNKAARKLGKVLKDIKVFRDELKDKKINLTLNTLSTSGSLPEEVLSVYGVLEKTYSWAKTSLHISNLAIEVSLRNDLTPLKSSIPEQVLWFA